MKSKHKLIPAVRFAHINAALDAIEKAALAPEFNTSMVGRVMELNADLLTEGSYREALTTYAVGFPGNRELDQSLEFFAPGVQVSNRFDYKKYLSGEAFYSETSDDLRAPGADFKQVEYTSEEVQAKTANRGLMIIRDRDQIKDIPNWEERDSAALLNRLKLNKLRRALSLISTAATNTAKTWSEAAGKNPDGDVRQDIVTAHTAAGVRPNRVGYGPSAWSYRVSSHEAQDNAGGYAAAARTPQQVAQYLAIEAALVAEARYATSASAKAEALSNLVLMFNAVSGALPEDASNVKGFWSSCENGQMFMVHRWDISPKRHAIAVEHYELTRVTSDIGIRKFTVSES